MSEESLVIEEGTPHPNKCAECGAQLLLTLGKYGPYYKCARKGCFGTAKAHADGVPTGKPAPVYVMGLRQQAHVLLDELCFRRRWDNNQLYAWIRAQSLPSGSFHISDMDIRDLRVLFRILQKQEDIRLGIRRQNDNRIHN
jgi:hypothetical protein